MEEKIKTVYVLLLALIMTVGFSLQVQAADVDTAQGLLIDEAAITGSFDYATTEFLIAYRTSGSANPGTEGGGTADDGYPVTPSGEPGSSGS